MMDDPSWAPGGVPGRDSVPKTQESDQIRIEQEQINENTFSSLSIQYERATRDVNFLEQALLLARTREKVLGAAMSVLSGESQQVAVPAVR